MAPNQRYVFNFGNPSPSTGEVLDKTIFEISRESTWSLRRQRTAMRIGGSSAHRSLEDIHATQAGELAKAVKGQQVELIEIRKSIDSLTHRLAPPSGYVTDNRSVDSMKPSTGADRLSRSPCCQR